MIRAMNIVKKTSMSHLPDECILTRFACLAPKSKGSTALNRPAYTVRSEHFRPEKPSLSESLSEVIALAQIGHQCQNTTERHRE